MADDNQNVDWTQPILAGELSRAKVNAGNAANTAWAWKNHAEALSQRLANAQKKLVQYTKETHEAIVQRDGWRSTAKHLRDTYCNNMEKEELNKIYHKYKAQAAVEYPYKGPA
jgi:lipopolysaccharide biosynthesis glycosyltransferase